MQFATLFANRTWFDFTVDGDVPGLGGLSVYAFSGKESVSVPYEFTIELVSKDSNLDLTDYLGKQALLTIADRSGKKRLVHGVIRQMDQLHTANAFTHYRCELVPRLFFLSQTQDHRIYQHQSVVQIIETVLRKHNFLAEAYSFNVRETYPEREYCVQYAESDLHFLSRICEEEGIFFYFEHSKDGHCLCFSDAEGGPSIPGESALRFYPGSGQPADTAVVARLNLRHRINSDSSTYREYNFTTPSLDLTGQKKEAEWEKAPVPQGMNLETYQFPHLYQVRNEGDRYTGIQLQRQLTFRQWIECESDVSRYMPGFTFSLYEHPRGDTNRGWWIVSVIHKGEQPQVLEHESPDDRGMHYNATVVALPDDTRFVPELSHKKIRIEGLQSAVVTGPAGEEAYVDEYGRVKVQFHWDRLGSHDENTTCWVRVTDPWAGTNFGFIQVPRIGQEVMVEFMEGDPDRPVITGRTYNAALMPPWQLPEQKTLSGIQSREFKGGQRNQLVLDDTEGQVQAQLSSDHGLAQLNLGYITRVDHIQGRKDKRGDGFELRTDDWGVVRAGAGMLISTHKRHKAESYQKDLTETAEGLSRGVDQHKRQADLALHHGAQVEEPEEYLPKMQRQLEEVTGTGGEQNELTAPQLVLSSPAGIGANTPETMHLFTGKDIAMTAMHNITAASAKSVAAMAMRNISLYAHQEGIKAYAGHGKVDIQAQSDDLDLIAEKVLRIISAKNKIHISAPEEILLTAGDSYVKIDGSGVEIGSKGAYRVHTADHKFLGPKSMPYIGIKLPSSAPCMAEASRSGFPFVEV